MIILPNKIITKNKKRVGRGIGSTHGKTCGRGHNGQKSRSGYARKRFFAGGQTKISISIPKMGFKSRQSKPTVINTDQLSGIKELSFSELEKCGLVKAGKVRVIYGKKPLRFSSYQEDPRLHLSKKVLAYVQELTKQS